MSYHHISDVLRDLDALIAKYEAIPEDQWMTGHYFDGGRCCALGHLGVRYDTSCDYHKMVRTRESDDVARLLSVYGRTLGDLVSHNDALCLSDPAVGATAKARVLNFLRMLRGTTPKL